MMFRFFAREMIGRVRYEGSVKYACVCVCVYMINDSFISEFNTTLLRYFAKSFKSSVSTRNRDKSLARLSRSRSLKFQSRE